MIFISILSYDNLKIAKKNQNQCHCSFFGQCTILNLNSPRNCIEIISLESESSSIKKPHVNLIFFSGMAFERKFGTVSLI